MKLGIVAAYDDADAQAHRARQDRLDTVWADAGPTAASEWRARHQAALEEAVLKVQEMSRQQGPWSSVAWSLENAATVMKPEALTAMVGRSPALSSAQAACVGR
ncbi:hypothetical protein AB0J35_56425 [Nonomuraea angiospora]|uniref:hypothetical protein n=1 Tax=Nonomuraea angiospora TaxID=46172 RepID=UPI00341D2313